MLAKLKLPRLLDWRALGILVGGRVPRRVFTALQGYAKQGRSLFLVPVEPELCRIFSPIQVSLLKRSRIHLGAAVLTQ